VDQEMIEFTTLTVMVSSCS